jgi:hypothetical protein
MTYLNILIFFASFVLFDLHRELFPFFREREYNLDYTGFCQSLVKDMNRLSIAFWLRSKALLSFNNSA